MADFAVLVTELDNSKRDQYFQDHMQYLDRLREQGIVLANGKFADGSLGLILFRAESQQVVEDLVNQSPFAVHGVRQFDVKEWPSKWAEGFGEQV
ncbi:YciI family protein [Paenibacillus thalictri]|uniref:YCII-related domain-containing protein n=1 Tax=Paenibacillus thalictri TaxID=2527873 RepID=A0A4Q9DFX3_9BACL|nr:YciI family protein [Paenibacillus thalictri]TBL70914.1 hypothetical protein EYB31_32265 [Paenibacillus thalictri]